MLSISADGNWENIEQMAVFCFLFTMLLLKCKVHCMFVDLSLSLRSPTSRSFLQSVLEGNVVEVEHREAGEPLRVEVTKPFVKDKIIPADS